MDYKEKDNFVIKMKSNSNFFKLLIIIFDIHIFLN